MTGEVAMRTYNHFIDGGEVEPETVNGWTASTHI